MSGELAPWVPPRPIERIESSREDALRGNTFGILDSDAPVEEKLGRLARLVPVALEIVGEARDTIGRLRDERAALDWRLAEVLAENERLRRGTATRTDAGFALWKEDPETVALARDYAKARIARGELAALWREGVESWGAPVVRWLNRTFESLFRT